MPIYRFQSTPGERQNQLLPTLPWLEKPSLYNLHSVFDTHFAGCPAGNLLYHLQKQCSVCCPALNSKYFQFFLYHWPFLLLVLLPYLKIQKGLLQPAVPNYNTNCTDRLWCQKYCYWYHQL